MSTVRELSVEIFRDADTPNVELRDAEFAVMRVRRIVAGINIVRMRRLVTVQTAPDGRIDMDRAPWSRFEADLNIIMTDRGFSSTDSGESFESFDETLGFAYNERTVDGPRVAIVNSLRADPSGTVAHEVGHLLDVDHCKRKVCLMYAHSNPKRQQFFCPDCNTDLKMNAAQIALAKLSAEQYV